MKSLRALVAAALVYSSGCGMIRNKMYERARPQAEFAADMAKTSTLKVSGTYMKVDKLIAEGKYAEARKALQKSLKDSRLVMTIMMQYIPKIPVISPKVKENITKDLDKRIKEIDAYLKKK